MIILYLYFYLQRKTKLDELLETTIEKITQYSQRICYLEDAFSILVFLINSTDCWIISLFSSSNDNPLAYFMLSAFFRIDSNIFTSFSGKIFKCDTISLVGSSKALNSNCNSIYSRIMVNSSIIFF